MLRKLFEKEILLEDFLLLLLFLFAVDLLDKSGILLILFVFGFIFLNITTKLVYDRTFVILVVFSCMYFLSLVIYDTVAVDTIVKYLIMPWAIYVFGMNFIGIQKKMSVTGFVYFITFGFFIHGMLNLISSIQTNGFTINSNYRYAHDFWQHRQISVTTAALYYSPFALLSACSLFLEKGKFVKLIAVISIALSVVATFNYQNRTLLIALAICIGGSVFIYFTDPVVNSEKKKMFILIVFLFLGALLVMFLSDAMGIRSWIEGTNLANRVGDEKQDRTTIWLSFLKGNPWKYPLGGSKVALYGGRSFVHNMWLDTFRRAGLVPFVTLIMFTISVIKSLRRFFVMNNNENGKLVVMFMLGIGALCMVEPILEANPYFFYIPIMIAGAVNGALVSGEINENNY